MWEIRYHNDDLQHTIMNFPPSMQARYVHLTQRMIEFGPNLGMPHTRAFGKGLFELRMKSREGIGRVFFCVLAGFRIVMLHAILKKTMKTPVRDLAIARMRGKEVQDVEP